MDSVGDQPGFQQTYNKWVANETLEDFALRFTARRARRWSSAHVANTALGSISFLALEAIGGSITLVYGFENAVAAILVVGAILFVTGFPIAWYAAKGSVDIDLLTRGAGFGYLGSTITSLIYAGFTFIFFALEAAILSLALELCFGIPLGLGYLLNALIVIPLVTHGFTRIGMLQKWSQPVWIVLQITPFVALAAIGVDLDPWFSIGAEEDGASEFDLVMFAAAAGVVLSLSVQIGEQVDFLRFLPEPTTRRERVSWWCALIAAGPGWAVIGTLKMLAGSLLAALLFAEGMSAEAAIDPTQMYLFAFGEIAAPQVAILLTGLLVILAQLKINVTNAYAGSIAWSNFFSRLTHNHPGRVVWLVFNVLIALMLMEFGVLGALEETLAVYAHVAVGWIGALAADLVINKPLKLSPPGVEFRRAYLYDVNPVGVGALLIATAVSLPLHLGVFGETAAAFSGFAALLCAVVAAPAIAAATRGRYYLARAPEPRPHAEGCACGICENGFDSEDMAWCPHHGRDICSLCCALEPRCGDMCKPHGAFGALVDSVAERTLPARFSRLSRSRFAAFAALAGGFGAIIGLTLLAVHRQGAAAYPALAAPLADMLIIVFGLLALVVGVAAWLQTLAHESRKIALQESDRQTRRLMAEIRAHERTDAELQHAKEIAEAANEAKSRYVAGISHELRTPLNAILGYAQLLENDPTLPAHRTTAVRVIRRSSEHLADLIEGLLDISKIEAGKLEISRQETAFRDLLEQMVAIFEPEAAEKGLTLNADIAPSAPDRVYADERRLRQILTNLLSNAVRYTERGSVTFTVSYRNEVAVFAVTDTGRGIAPEDQERILLPFERVEDPERPVIGTGLGLTITKLLVEILGGDLQIDSARGRGSRFQVRLMLPRITGAAARERPRRIFGYKGRRRALLVVDDNADHRALLAEALRPLGFTVLCAESAEAARAVAAATPPDLALIDVAMPGENGWRLAERLRREHGLKAPIVMISAHASESPDDSSLPAHHDDFLAKPVNLDLLLSRIGRHLRIEWLTEPEANAAAPRVKPRVPAPVLDAIAALSAIGHARGVEAKIDAMAADTPAAAAFIAAARARVEALDFRGLDRLLAEARHDG